MLQQIVADIHRRTHIKSDGRKLFLYAWRENDQEVETELPGEPTAATPHLRWHALRREWVAYASHRQQRTFKPPASFCPLCPTRPGGHPGEIPFRSFEIAVFENRFPAFVANPPALSLPVETGLAAGACEVVVFSAEHTGSLATLSRERRELLVRVWADRYRDLLRRDDVRFVMPFENRGEEVGVTLHHPHGQIYAFPFIPPALEKTVEAFRAAPVLRALRRQVGTDYDVAGNDHAVALVPPFARFPNEVWIMPRAFHPGPWTFSDQETAGFADVLGQVVDRYDRLFGRPMPYVATLYAAPKGEEEHFHFHMQFYPFLRSADRLKYLAGCEQAAGTFLADILPEKMVAQLRAAAAS